MFKFESKRYAESFRERCLKTMMIVLGDDDKFWVVTGRIASKLARAGYEIY